MVSGSVSQHAKGDWGNLTKDHPPDEELHEINGFQERENHLLQGETPDNLADPKWFPINTYT